MRFECIILLLIAGSCFGQPSDWKYKGNACAHEAVVQFYKSASSSFSNEGRPQRKDILLVKITLMDSLSYDIENWKEDQSNIVFFKKAIASLLENVVNCYPEQKHQIIPLLINTPDGIDGKVTEDDLTGYLGQYKQEYFVWEPLEWYFYKPSHKKHKP